MAKTELDGICLVTSNNILRPQYKTSNTQQQNVHYNNIYCIVLKKVVYLWCDVWCNWAHESLQTSPTE